MNLRERKDCLLFSKTSGRICTVKRDYAGIIQEEEQVTEIQTESGGQRGKDTEKSKRIQQDKPWKTVIKTGAITRGVGTEELFFLRKEILNTKVFIADMGLTVMSLNCSCKEPEFDSQHIHKVDHNCL